MCGRMRASFSFSAGVTPLRLGPIARSAEFTRYPGAAEGASAPSATGIAARSAMRSNLSAGSAATSPSYLTASASGRSGGPRYRQAPRGHGRPACLPRRCAVTGGGVPHMTNSRAHARKVRIAGPANRGDDEGPASHLRSQAAAHHRRTHDPARPRDDAPVATHRPVGDTHAQPVRPVGPLPGRIRPVPGMSDLFPRE